MNFLIEIYDNFLIYYPNIFFPFLFLLSILGTILLFRLIIFLNKESRRIARGIRINLGKVKIKKIERVEITTPKLTINFFHLVKFVWILIIKISNTLGYLKLIIGKIVAKIKKEVLID